MSLRLIEPGLPKNVERDVQLQEELPPVHGSRQQIEQMVIDLCLNACEAMPEGGQLTVGTTVTEVEKALAERCVLYSGRTGPHVALTVSDTGLGMDEQALQRAFEPFHTSKELGHGLGLSALYGSVAAQVGAIEVISSPGKGTTLRVYLPIAQV
jgi:signal transduction histidine kinase